MIEGGSLKCIWHTIYTNCHGLNVQSLLCPCLPANTDAPHTPMCAPGKGYSKKRIKTYWGWGFISDLFNIFQEWRRKHKIQTWQNYPKYVLRAPNTYLFTPILHEFDTLFMLRTYSGRLWKYTFLCVSLDAPVDTPLAIIAASRD